jgi:esterase/lipase
MRTFNLAEELEKERKKNKELEERIKEFKLTIGVQFQQIQELIGRIDKAIEHIENEAIIENLKADHTYITINQDDLLDILRGNNE